MSANRTRTGASIALGQHNLRSQLIAQRIVASTGLAPPELVFDLGAGDGTLTEALAVRSERVVAVEIDRSLWSELKQKFRDNHRVKVVLGDLLAVDFPRTGRYHIVANIPYGLAAEVIRRITRLPNAPKTAHLVVDRRTAQKWVGLGHETVASVLLKNRFEVELAMALKRTDFVPYAMIDSVVVRLRLRPSPQFAGSQAQLFERFVRRGFERGHRSHANKGQLPHELSFEEWVSAFTKAPRGRR